MLTGGGIYSGYSCINHTYREDLLLSLKKSPEELETEARLLLAVKMYELGQISTGGCPVNRHEPRGVYV